MNIRLMKIVDGFLGRLSVKLLLKAPADASATKADSILLIRPGGIGDAVHLVPAIQAVRMKFPSAQISVLAERRNASVFQFCPDVHRVLLYDRPSDLLTALRGGYDVVIDSEQWHRLSAVVARLTRAPLLIGFATNERARLFSHPIEYSHDDYEVDSFFNLLAPLGIEPTQPAERFLTVPAAAAEKGAELLALLGGRQFVTIFPGASIAERRWGAERFGRLAQMLAAYGIAVVVVGGKEDREQGEAIVSDRPGLNLAGRTSLVETAAVINRGALLVGGDSGVLHIAVGLGRPTVSLFGPGRARKWAPRGDRHCVINKGLPCSPCTTYGTTPPCRIDALCMREIGVEEVLNAVTILLASTGAIPPSCCKRGWLEVGVSA
ncbi:MAG: glycosyltransferase family 9 protein [Deltaproteobacteria bacterium]|nr:glycosyltransferase family 9 protein [Deltaproteobacteria bacterium]